MNMMKNLILYICSFLRIMPLYFSILNVYVALPNLTLNYLLSHITAKPEPPYELIASTLTSTSVTLTWVPGFDGGEMQWFVISYRSKSDQSSIIQIPDEIPGAEYTIDGLDPFQEYTFTVCSSNTLGKSEGGPAITLTTLREYQVKGAAQTDFFSSLVVFVACWLFFVISSLGLLESVVCIISPWTCIDTQIEISYGKGFCFTHVGGLMIQFVVGQESLIGPGTCITQELKLVT